MHKFCQKLHSFIEIYTQIHIFSEIESKKYASTIKGLKSKYIQLFRVQCFGNRNEFDNFDKLLQLGNSNRIDIKKSQHILICWDIFLSN